MNSLPDDPKVNDALQRVLRGETAEFEVVLRRYERSLRAWLTAHVPMGVDVDEIAQRSFVAAFLRLEEFEIGTNFLSRTHLTTVIMSTQSSSLACRRKNENAITMVTINF